MELHLPELIEAVHQVSSNLFEPYWEETQRQVCDFCQYRHGRFCPCPMDYLLVLVVEAIETVDARHDRRKAVRNHPSQSGITTEDLQRFYDEAKDSWTGCDWTTSFGRSGLDLNGCTAARARRKAKSCTNSDDAADWQRAADWLGKVESQAKESQERASMALEAAIVGNWQTAVQHAQAAWASEFATGRMLWRGYPMTWQRFFFAIQAAAEVGQRSPMNVAVGNGS